MESFTLQTSNDQTHAELLLDTLHVQNGGKKSKLVKDYMLKTAVCCTSVPRCCCCSLPQACGEWRLGFLCSYCRLKEAFLSSIFLIALISFGLEVSL